LPIGAWLWASSAALQAQPLDRVDHRLAEHRLIDAMPMIGREAGDPGEVLEVELLVEMSVDIVRSPG